MLPTDNSAGPDLTPPDRPDLRSTRFHEHDGVVDRWIWERAATAWRFDSRRTRAEVDAGVEEQLRYQREHPLTEAEMAQAQEVAKEIDLGA